MKNFSHSKYTKRIAYAETNSPRQVEKFSVSKNGEEFYELTEAERKQLKQSHFAFGSIYPYIFDGLNYIATHHKKFSEEYGRGNH